MQNNDEMYKEKYLKYKTKYLALQSGGLFDSFVILTKFENIKQFLPSEEILEFSSDCTNVEKNLFNKAHVYKKKTNNFDLITTENPICGKTISLLEAKKKVSEGATEFGKTMKSVAQPMLEEILKVAKEEGKRTLTTIGTTAKTEAEKRTQQLGEKITTVGTRQIQKIGQKIDTKLTHQSGGSKAQQIISVLNSLNLNYNNADAIEKIISENQYNIVIKFVPSVIGKSKFYVTKLI